MPRAALKESVGERGNCAPADCAARKRRRVLCVSPRLPQRRAFGAIETPHQDAGLWLDDHAGCARERLAGQGPLGALRPDAPATGHVVAQVAERNDELFAGWIQSQGALHAPLAVLVFGAFPREVTLATQRGDGLNDGVMTALDALSRRRDRPPLRRCPPLLVGQVFEQDVHDPLLTQGDLIMRFGVSGVIEQIP